MEKRIRPLAFAALVLMCFLPVIGAGKPANPEDEPSAYVLIEAATGTVLEQYNADTQLSCGYLAKLMSLLLIAEDVEAGKYSPDTELTASESVRGTKGSVVWLEPGDRMTVDELLKSVIVGNANDALTVLAEASEGNTESFVMRMNAEVFDLGLRDTAFYSPYGFDDEREHTTAADLAVICAALSKHEVLAPYFAIWRDFVKSGTVEVVSENYLAHTYKRHCGFKAAHSERSGHCIAEYARSEDGDCYIAVVLGATDGEAARKMAKTLCEKGFSGYNVTMTMFPDEMLRPVRVRHGVETAVELRIREQSSLVLPNDSNGLRTVAVLPKYLDAPVTEGQRVGTAAFYNGKVLVYESDIIAAADVERLSFTYVLTHMLLKMIE
ncbi:MAG: D-alanyl-D-alanine carboxypeptidase [Ruminococcus sp.]|nr:D-alanyl-D-alanine carboxypeptidase [Ruminococcus sp.]